MRSFAQRQNQPQKPVSSSLARPNMATPGQARHEQPLLHLQRAIGNQAAQRMLKADAEEVGLTDTSSPRFRYDFSRTPIHPPTAGAIHTKSAINKPGDEHNVADAPEEMEAMRSDPISPLVAPGLHFDFTRVPLTAPTIQRKPTVSSPGDLFEREADNVAERVMRMVEPVPTGLAPAAIQRKCAECEDEEKKPIQTKPASSAHTGAAPDAGAAVRAAMRGGTPLSREARSYFEPRFGHDFSGVRVHADGEAADAARAVRARAYTIGQDIVFGTGEYAPTTVEGKRLLAHELVHVVQQTSSAWTQGAFAVQRPEPKDARKKMGSEPEVQRKEDNKPDAGTREPPKEERPKEEKTEAKEKMTNCQKNYLVESWEKDTCCVNHGFSDPSAKNKKAGADCCNTFPEFVDNEATKLGFDGAASCRTSDFLNHRARVTPGPGGKSPVEVLCVDTRRKKGARVIELGYKAAQKAYGSPSVSDPKATVCIGDKEEAKTCFFETDCDKTTHPKESQCMPASCSKTDAAGSTEKQAEPKK